MRVERFSLFFPPLIARRRRGETEYAIGSIPLGGYVKITGMNPAEEIPPEVAHRAYFRQPVWKRVFVIGAGPAVNIALALILLTAYLLIWGTPVSTPTNDVEGLAKGGAAASVLRVGDRVVAVDGKRGDPEVLRDQVATHTCAEGEVDGCKATTPADGHDRARRQGADGRDHADLQRGERAAAARLQLRGQAHVRAGRAASARRSRPASASPGRSRG